MISHLRGLLWYKAPERVIIDVNGVGYEVQIPLSTYERLPGENQTVTLLTIYRVREDSAQLYGFFLEEERLLFEILTTKVSNIGPKTALAILSSMSVERFCEAVYHRDIQQLTTINGIGRKTAERIVMELKDQISELLLRLPQKKRTSEEKEEVSSLNREAEDAIHALIALGLQPNEARYRIRTILQSSENKTFSTQELIRLALSRN